MSRRTLPRIGTTALIAFALVAPPPILAAGPNPWHSSAPEIAPAPREKTHGVHFTGSLAVHGQADTVSLRIELANDRSVQTVYVPTFLNLETQAPAESALAKALTRTVTTAIADKTQIRVVPDVAQADTILIGTIQTVSKTLVNRDAEDSTRQVHIAATVELQWRDLHTGRLLSAGPTGHPTRFIAVGQTIPELGESTTTAIERAADQLAAAVIAIMNNPSHQPDISVAPHVAQSAVARASHSTVPAPAPSPVVAIAPAAAIPPRQPQGTWYREIPGAVAAITFHPDGEAITAKITCNSGGAVWVVTLTGDCATTKDGTVHGVITGADMTILEAKAGAGVDLAGLGAQLQGLVDQPFAFRCRTTDGGLMIGKWQLGGIEGWLPTNGRLLAGKYQSAASSPVPLPLPKPSRDLELSPTFPPSPPRVAEPIPLPPPASPSANTMIPGTNCLPVPVGPAPNMCPTPPPEVLDIMVGTFGQMLGTPLPGSGAPGPCPAVPFCPQPGIILPVPVPSSPPPVCVTVPRPYPPTVEAPKPPLLTPAGWYVAPPAPPLTAPAPVMERGQLPVGTWVREVGAMRFVIAIKDEHMTITASMCVEEDSNTTSVSIIVIADCYARRDRVGLLGIITSVDVRANGANLKAVSSEDLMGFIKPLQKAVTESLLSLTYRVRDDVLLIGDIQVVTTDATMKNKVDDLASYLCGQYHRATGPLKKQKPSNPVQWVAGMTLPSPRYLEHTPQYIPSDPAFPLPRELQIQVAPAPREKLPSGGTVVLPMLPPDPLPLSPPTR